MKFEIIGLSIAIPLLMVGCSSPAHIINLPLPNDAESSTIMIYREPAFNYSHVGLIFGASSQDYVSLSNNDYAEIKVRSGSYNFFVRSDQADVPINLTMDLKSGDNKCLKAYVNPSNGYKAILPFLYYTSNTFSFEAVECPSENKLLKYNKIAVKYDNVSETRKK